MSLLVFLDLAATGVYLYLAVYILIVNPKSLVNRACSAFLFCFGLYGIDMLFVHNANASREATLLVTHLTAPGWIGFSSFFLWFIAAFTGKKKLLKNKFFYLIIFGIPLIFMYKQWTSSLYIDCVKVYYGWRPVLSKSIWTYLFFFYALAFTAIGLYINFDFIRKTRNPRLRKQAKISFGCMMIVLVLSTITDIIMILADVNALPNISCLLLLIWAVGVVYAMTKYRFLTITPATAAENIIDTMFDCLLLLDMEGTIITVNKAVSDLLGYDGTELKGLPLGTLFTAQALDAGLDKKIIAEGNIKNEELLFKSKEGNEIHVLFSGSTLRDEKETAAGIVCIAKNISELKKLEAERNKSKKLESIGILAGGIAHDFNNLLSVILGNIVMAKDDANPATSQYDFLLKAEETSIKAGELVSRFIALSAGGWMKKEPISATRLADTAKHLKTQVLTDLQSKNVAILIDLPENLGTVDGDKKQLEQVLKNLLLNALDAVSAGGEITLHREDIQLDADNKFLLKEGPYMKLEIHDNGCGIPAEHLENIFDPYFSTKNTFTQKGLGLGLTTCYAVIKKHDGHIEVKSKAGEGSNVIIHLPTSSS